VSRQAVEDPFIVPVTHHHLAEIPSNPGLIIERGKGPWVEKVGATALWSLRDTPMLPDSQSILLARAATYPTTASISAYLILSLLIPVTCASTCSQHHRFEPNQETQQYGLLGHHAARYQR